MIPKLIPKYVRGTEVIHSSDFVREAFKETFTTQFFWIDDVYVNAIIRMKLNVQLKSILRLELRGIILRNILIGKIITLPSPMVMVSEHKRSRDDMIKLRELPIPYREANPYKISWFQKNHNMIINMFLTFSNAKLFIIVSYNLFFIWIEKNVFFWNSMSDSLRLKKMQSMICHEFSLKLTVWLCLGLCFFYNWSGRNQTNLFPNKYPIRWNVYAVDCLKFQKWNIHRNCMLWYSIVLIFRGDSYHIPTGNKRSFGILNPKSTVIFTDSNIHKN